MSNEFQLIREVSPGTTGWTVKVVVTEKFSPRIAQKSPTKYQNLILIDSELSSKLSIPTDEKNFTEIRSIQGLKTVDEGEGVSTSRGEGLGNRFTCNIGCRVQGELDNQLRKFGWSVASREMPTMMCNSK
ncbi:hypothetical protein Fot_39568 [Forsythia ovata]|uniref:Uncharacterized protein n=1 Tax=Forsythia ovata TaxID=205694 RepID=A0ABD1S5P0_9LAMI